MAYREAPPQLEWQQQQQQGGGPAAPPPGGASNGCDFSWARGRLFDQDVANLLFEVGGTRI